MGEGGSGVGITFTRDKYAALCGGDVLFSLLVLNLLPPTCSVENNPVESPSNSIGCKESKRKFTERDALLYRASRQFLERALL